MLRHASVAFVLWNDRTSAMSERFVGDGRLRLSGRCDACPKVGDRRRKGWVGLGRGAWIAPGPFPQAALRTGRAILTASGSPRGQAVGLMTVTGHGVGIRLPRQR